MIFKTRDYLIKRENWCPVEDITGELNVLNSEIIEDAFQRIIEDWKPTKKNIIFSLCTKTRPYIKSKKWSTFYKCFGEDAELVICSNGGIIPLEYMNCFPFLEYDAPHTDKYTELYKDVFKRRLQVFLNKFYFEKYAFIFAPNTRNYMALQEFPLPVNSILFPDGITYEKIKRGDDHYIGIGRGRFSICSDTVLCEVEKFFGIKSEYLNELHQIYNQTTEISMEDIFYTVFQKIGDEGYTMEELIYLMNDVPNNNYSKVYMQKTIKGHTENLDSELNRTGDLLYLGGKYYRKNGKRKTGKLF